MVILIFCPYNLPQDHDTEYSLPKNSMPTEGDCKKPYNAEVDIDSKTIDLTIEQDASGDKLSFSIEENVSSDSHAKSSEECRDRPEIHPSKEVGRFRPRKVNPKLRSPVPKLVQNKRVEENKGI